MFRKDDIDRELRTHLELEAAEQEQAGLSPSDARYAARRASGNTTLIQEEVREMWKWTWLERMLQDSRFALRILCKHPAFTLAALLTLALGIGANAAMFSVVYSVLIEPLPYPQADRLMFLAARNPTGAPLSLSYPDFLDWQQQTQAFESLAAYQSFGFTLTGWGETERLAGRLVSATFFSTLGAEPSLGRDFRGDDDRAGAQPVVILSDQAWRRLFHADHDILDRSITLNGSSFTVVGVLPPGFQLYLSGEVFAPIGLGLRSGTRGQRRGVYALGRLQPGGGRKQAQVEADTIAARLARQYPDTNGAIGALVQPLAENFAGKTRPTLILLFGAVTFVLLIACANVGNLVLARSASRQKEIALRLAIGASRLRVLRQLFTENLLLALIGGVSGLVVAAWCLRAVHSLLPIEIARMKAPGVNGWVVGFTLFASVVAGLLFGLVPARQSIEQAGLGSRGSANVGRRSILSFLIGSEVALSLVLLVGAGLMIRTLLSLEGVDPGFRAPHVFHTQIALSSTQYTPDRQAAFFAQAIERTRALPGVETAAAVMCLPLSGSCWSNPVEFDDGLARANQQSEVNFNAISPGYFRTLGIPLLKGRDFDRHDTRDAPVVAIVSQAFAHQYFNAEDPVGKRVRERSGGRGAAWATIVGVAGDVRRDSLDLPAAAEVFLPFPQSPVNFMSLVARAAANPADLAQAIRGQLQSLDRGVPLQATGTMEQLESAGLSTRQLPATLLELFAAVALLLALVGIYGVISYSVSQRTHEIGIRMAVGAKPMDVVRLIVGQGLKPVWAGVAAGLGASVVLGRTLTSVLYGITPTDPLTFASVSLLLLAIALLACAVPASRAAHIDPLIALRRE